MSGDDNREWTISSWVARGAMRDGVSIDGPVTGGSLVVVPRSRLERVEAERDKLREERDALIETLEDLERFIGSVGGTVGEAGR